MDILNVVDSIKEFWNTAKIKIAGVSKDKSDIVLESNEILI